MEYDDRCGWCGGSGSTADCPEEDDATTTCPECHGLGKEPGLPPVYIRCVVCGYWLNRDDLSRDTGMCYTCEVE